MRVKPIKPRGTILLEVGSKDLALLSEESEFHLQSVLVPTDFSQSSDEALRYALAFAKQFHAEVMLLHVTEVPPGTAEGGIAITPGMIEEMNRRAAERLSALSSGVQPRGVPIRTLVRTGAPYHEIVEAARDEDADMIILSTHGRTGLKRLFLGSTAERVVRHAPCPVIVLREKRRRTDDDMSEQASSKRDKRRAPPVPLAALPP